MGHQGTVQHLGVSARWAATASPVLEWIGEGMVFSVPSELQPGEERCPLGAVAADRGRQV